ncbi:MAG: hypothetical protein A2622_08890 [Bdellovibrionales bacterium RIFCSPHIGHO2_01_FULL_40_29]|nr:MAG: hypothetical protein A2622_08890 [Bdellovibrionales bacterium RIFCSPHIGHO2_01_FULL_40_29]OFZ32854.1 MAG: hypothetical protein A3D17_09100 [Bdellovibrionales bacterium RIFCSPHIGHO2_02_FULL_40_15]
MIPILRIGSLQIPTFFLVISLSLSALLVFLSYRVDQFRRDRQIAFNLALILMIGGFIGGRLLHVFYEEWLYYAADPKLILYFWNGGFVYYGGFLVAWPTAWIYCRIKKISFSDWANFFTPLISLSHALGRIGCILTGCCFGQFCELPWSVAGRHPTAWYLAIGELIIFAVLMFLEKKSREHKKVAIPELLFFKWLFLHALLRYIVEFYRDDFRGRSVPIFGLGSISISQALCLLLMLISLGAFFRKKLPRR